VTGEGLVSLFAHPSSLEGGLAPSFQKSQESFRQLFHATLKLLYHTFWQQIATA